MSFRVFNKISFRQHLFAIVTIGLIGLALTTAVVTAWVTGHRTRELMVAQGLRITKNLADQSILALLYQSQDNADAPLMTIMSFPDVIQAGVIDHKGKPLHIIGKQADILHKATQVHHFDNPALTQETSTHWKFVAPVISRGAGGQLVDDPFAFGNDSEEFLGTAFVIMSKATLRQMQIDILFNSTGIAISFALVLIGVLNLTLRRLTRPLIQLSQVMKEAKREGTYVLAAVEGPTEISVMARAYNRMMGALKERDRHLRNHKEMLQSEVEIRTRELVQARDAALSASRHKSEFLTNMSHELRTPLQAVIGYADLLKEDMEVEGLDDNIEDLNCIIKNAQRLLGLINNILDLSKVEAGRMELFLQPVQLTEVVQEASDTISPLMLQNNVQFDVHVEGEQSRIVLDREKFLQILINLLSNAAKFSKDSEVTLRATCNAQYLTASVADTGIGLSEEQQNLIFEEFRQVDGSTTRNFEGTGLGLAITRRFCHLMGGEIDVHSVQGKGATFTVKFPLPIRQHN